MRHNYPSGPTKALGPRCENIDAMDTVGELEICNLCDGAPHLSGCPLHRDYDNERVVYARTDAIDDAGPASYWVDDTFAAAARDSGEPEEESLREGIREFHSALQRGDIRQI